MENTLLRDKHVFIYNEGQFEGLDPIYQTELEYIKANFCGRIYDDFQNTYPENAIIYICGNITENYQRVAGIPGSHTVCIVRGLSYNLPDNGNCRFVSIGEVPINIHNVGVYFRQFFNGKDYFNLIKNAHAFQDLTLSDKPGLAFRKGIYLSAVTPSEDQLHFNLLRCSTNLSGPTENFRDVDNEIINRLNETGQSFFAKPFRFNHVLAQIYQNQHGTADKEKEKKAVIKAHSDKTKDMPRNAVMAFTTFYDLPIDKTASNGFDICYNGTSVLTRLHFRLKSAVTDPNLVREFSLTLYPGSVFMISLDTNRLYTHEIRPSVLPIDKLPTRMGYVVRCSNTKAVFKDGATYLDKDGTLTQLRPIAADDVQRLQKLYFKENTTIEIIDYGDINFSMNTGDYKMPIV